MEERGLARATIARRLSTVAGFYRICVLHGLIEHSPAGYLRRPKIHTESATLGLDRMELPPSSPRPPPRHHGPRLACLLGLLGLRVAEACSINIEDLATERGHRIVTVLGKGSKLAVIPLPPRVARAVDLAAGQRLIGTTPADPAGGRMNRPAATRIVRRLARRPGSPNTYPRTRCGTASSPPPSTPAWPCETSRSRPVTPIPAPPPATTEPATTSTATPATSSPPTSPAPPNQPGRPGAVESTPSTDPFHPGPG